MYPKVIKISRTLKACSSGEQRHYYINAAASLNFRPVQTNWQLCV